MIYITLIHISVPTLKKLEGFMAVDGSHHTQPVPHLQPVSLLKAYGLEISRGSGSVLNVLW